jgi:broad-specificity NMP kinase
VFAVVVTGPPGSGKTSCLTALTDALVDDKVSHASLDMDEVAWAYPFPSVEERAALLGNAWEGHRRMGHDVLLFCEVVESSAHLAQLLYAVGADDHLLVRLEATPATMRERIVAREPPGWSGLEHLLGEVEPYAVSQRGLDGVHVTLDSEQLSPEQEAARIQSERPDKLAG